MAMGGVAPTVMTLTQLAVRGPYVNVQFIWDAALAAANLLFNKPYRDADGTARVHPVTYINLAALFEITAAGSEDPGPSDAAMIAQEAHDGTYTAVAALTDAQAEALTMRNVVWVDADPTGGTGLVGALAGSPGTWVIVLPSLLSVVTGTLGGHVGGGAAPAVTGNMGTITMAELAGVNRLTVNFISFGAGGGAESSLYTIAGSRNTFVINLAETIVASEIDAACH